MYCIKKVKSKILVYVIHIRAVIVRIYLCPVLMHQLSDMIGYVIVLITPEVAKFIMSPRSIFF